MKKTWNVPSIETLDVRMTEDGDMQWIWEGEIIYKPDNGQEVIHEVHS